MTTRTEFGVGVVKFLPDSLSRHILVGDVEGMGGMDGWSKDGIG